LVPDEGDDLVQVRSLRGGMPTFPESVRNPVVPAITTGTVDMIGSRLLWRGYGVGWGRRPIEAALVGVDSWIVLDEAHLAGQLRRTLDVLARQATEETWLDGAVPGRWVTSMTATPTASGDGLSIDWSEEFAAQPTLARRHQQRRDTVVTVEIGSVQAAVMSAVERTPVSPGRLTIIFFNTVTLARAAAVKARRRKDLRADQVLLLVGGSPSQFRDQIMATVAPYRTGDPGRAAAPGLLVLATQTLEVGADLDADEVLTQTASAAALRQRLGRCNRVGARGKCKITVWVNDPYKPDPVYGEAERAVHDQLLTGAPTRLGDLDDLLARLAPVDGEPAAVMPRHMFDAYVRTRGSVNEPPVGRWLRPPEDPRAEVEVCFRDSVAQIRDEFALVDHLASFPPRPDEIWTVPISLARDTVKQELKAGRSPVVVSLAPRSKSRGEVALGEASLQPGMMLICAPQSDAFGIPGAGEDLTQHGPSQDRRFWLEQVDDADAVELPTECRVLVTEDGADTGWREHSPLRTRPEEDEQVPACHYSLEEHGRDVQRRVGDWARRLGLPAVLTHDLELAGLLHDQGKAADVMQNDLRLELHADGQLRLMTDGPPVAKSTVPRRFWRRCRRMSGVPDGYRHEAGSADSFDERVGTEPVLGDEDLVRQLVLTHHGAFRGPAPSVISATVSIPTYQDCSHHHWAEQPERYAALLRRYGPYSLAYAEMVLRLADWLESARLSHQETP
jgi:CRISPR-associated endonuclease/helicase Cas3